LRLSHTVFDSRTPMNFNVARERDGLDISATSSGSNGNPQDETAPGVTVFVCRSCRDDVDPNAEPRPGSRLADAVIEKAQESGIAVRSVNCLANCKRGLSAVLRSADGWSYVFGGLTPGDAEDLLTGARLLSAAPDGLMPWRGRPEPLKRGMVARIPPFDFTEERS
jgi:predicted metal-binding protein